MKASAGLGAGCIVILVLLAVNLSLGGLAVQYVLTTAFGLHPEFMYCAIAGLFLGEIAIPAAIITWIISTCGAHIPFWHLSMMANFVTAHI
jgi:hypothetical protein